MRPPSSAECFELFVRQADCCFDAVNWKVSHARCEAAAGLRQISSVWRRACRFRDAMARNARSCPVAVCVSAVNIVVGWAVGVIGTGPEYCIPDEYISVAPERGVIAVRPEREGQEVAEEVGPEHRSGPTAPSSTPPVPPVRIAPLVPSGATAQRTSGAQGASISSAHGAILPRDVPTPALLAPRTFALPM